MKSYPLQSFEHPQIPVRLSFMHPNRILFSTQSRPLRPGPSSTLGPLPSTWRYGFFPDCFAQTMHLDFVLYLFREEGGKEVKWK